MGETRTTDTETRQDRAANAPVGEHPAQNVKPPSNPDAERHHVEEGEEKLRRLSTH